MAFTVTYLERPQSLGPNKMTRFTYTALASDVTGTVTPPTFADRVDQVIIDGGMGKTAADSFSGTTATLTIQCSLNVNYTITCTSASATVGSIYAAANGQLFATQATIASATTLVSTSQPTANALAASGTLTKISGTGDSTITYSAVTVPTVYGAGVAYGI